MTMTPELFWLIAIFAVFVIFGLARWILPLMIKLWIIEWIFNQIGNLFRGGFTGRSNEFTTVRSAPNTPSGVHPLNIIVILVWFVGVPLALLWAFGVI